MNQQTPNLTGLLHVNLDSIEKPKPLPVGTYIFMVKSIETGKSRDKQTPYVRYACQPMGFEADVDVEKISAIDLSKKSINLDFFITKDALFRLKDFLAKVGLDITGKMADEVVPQAVGRAFKAYVNNELSTKPGDDSIYSRIDSNKILPA